MTKLTLALKLLIKGDSGRLETGPPDGRDGEN